MSLYALYGYFPDIKNRNFCLKKRDTITHRLAIIILKHLIFNYRVAQCLNSQSLTEEKN